MYNRAIKLFTSLQLYSNPEAQKHDGEYSHCASVHVHLVPSFSTGDIAMYQRKHFAFFHVWKCIIIQVKAMSNTRTGLPLPPEHASWLWPSCIWYYINCPFVQRSTLLAWTRFYLVWLSKRANDMLSLKRQLLAEQHVASVSQPANSRCVPSVHLLSRRLTTHTN